MQTHRQAAAIFQKDVQYQDVHRRSSTSRTGKLHDKFSSSNIVYNQKWVHI